VQYYAAVVQAWPITSIPHYLHQLAAGITHWSDPLEVDGAGGDNPSLAGAYHGLDLAQGSDYHLGVQVLQLKQLQRKWNHSTFCAMMAQKVTANKDQMNKADSMAQAQRTS
jgi:hypothetical protein